jgi:hypothetical protein
MLYIEQLYRAKVMLVMRAWIASLVTTWRCVSWNLDRGFDTKLRIINLYFSLQMRSKLASAQIGISRLAKPLAACDHTESDDTENQSSIRGKC